MKKGFTMIELIFVIVILGILAAVAIPKLAATRDDAKLAAIKTDIGTFVSAVPAWYQGQRDARIAEAVSLDTAQWLKDATNERYTLSFDDPCVTIEVWDMNVSVTPMTAFHVAVDGTDFNSTNGRWLPAASGSPVFRIMKPTANLSIDPVCTTLWTMINEQNITMAGKSVVW